MEDLKVTGIAIGVDNNLIYECSNPDVMQEFKAYLDSSEVKHVNRLNLWIESDGIVYFLRVKPEKDEDREEMWVVDSGDFRFTFSHREGYNLLDEIIDQLRIYVS